jgi:triphosphoribosyl-dephospho-CoA synthase
MGSTLLMAFQAAGLGFSLEAYECDSVEHVMGATLNLVEREGVKGAVNVYRALQLVAPSYLARISVDGLPDATTGHLALEQLEESNVTLAELVGRAGIYDPVLRDLATGLSISLGYAYAIARSEFRGGDEVSIIRALERATYGVAGWHDDLVLKRKLGRSLRHLWELAYKGAQEALVMIRLELYGVEAGPGSSADVAVNAIARLVYEIAKTRR